MNIHTIQFCIYIIYRQSSVHSLHNTCKRKEYNNLPARVNLSIQLMRLTKHSMPTVMYSLKVTSLKVSRLRDCFSCSSVVAESLSPLITSCWFDVFGVMLLWSIFTLQNSTANTTSTKQLNRIELQKPTNITFEFTHDV